VTKAKISEYDSSAGNNTDVNGVNIAEGCAPSGINNAIREVMAALKRFETGSDGDSITVGGNFVVSGTASLSTTTTGPINGTTIPSSKTLVVTTDIGTSVQAYDADTAKTDVAQTFTAKQTFGTTTKIEEVLEKITVSATAATGTINFDALTQGALYYTTNASGNWTLNVRGDSGTSLNTMMATGESLTVVFLVTQGSTAYYNSAFQIDGNAVTPKWQGGSAPTAGNASSIDAYTYVIVKTGSATFTVFASIVDFA
jgi:hypothetical protein